MEEIKELMMTPGVSGFEDPIRDLIRKKAAPYGEAHTDSMGNLFLTLGGIGPKLLISSHMDEIGMIVTRVDDDGHLGFRTIGRGDFGGIMGSDADFRFLAGRALEIHTKDGDIVGVIGMVPPHLMVRKEAHRGPPDIARMSIDVGANDPEEVRDMGIEIMDPVTIVKTFAIMRDKIISGRALDNRYGCAVVLELLRRVHAEQLKMSVTFAWTVQEEVGARGARFLGHRLRPDYAIIVDSSASTDFPHAPHNLPSTRLGKGPVIRWIDNGAIVSRPMVRFIQSVAREKRIPYQIGVIYSGTDASVIRQEGAMTIPLAVPIRYTHTSVEMMDMDDFAYLVDPIQAALLKLDKRGGLGEI